MPALGRLVEAGDAVEHGGLAGAVRPDQRGDGAALDVEGQIVDGDEAAEAHGQMLDAEHRAAVARHAISRVPSLTRSAEMLLRSFRNTDGSRVEISPRGRQIMISHHGEAEQQHAVLGRIEGRAENVLEEIELRKISVPPIMTMAAMATPIWLPMPPSTTIARMVADSMKVKDSGEMNPWRAAKNEPAKPANIAPMAKAVSLVLVVLMPSERQAISSSRNASQARPIGSRRSRR